MVVAAVVVVLVVVVIRVVVMTHNNDDYDSYCNDGVVMKVVMSVVVKCEI